MYSLKQTYTEPSMKKIILLINDERFLCIINVLKTVQVYTNIFKVKEKK